MIDYLTAVIDYLRTRVAFRVGEVADKGGVAVSLAGGDIEESIGGAVEYRAVLDLTAIADGQAAALAMLHDASAALVNMPAEYEDAANHFRATVGITVESLPAAESVTQAGVYAVSMSVAVLCEEL